MFKKIAIVLAVVLVVFVGVGFVLPASYNVTRDVHINAPAAVVFDLVDDLQKNELWAPWKESDPSMTTTYGPITKGQGAISYWTSEKMGEGQMAITESMPNTQIKMALEFGKKATGEAMWTFEEADGATHVTWSATHNVGGNIIGRYMGLFKERMAKHFETGLNNLKTVAEASAVVGETAGEMPADATAATTAETAETAAATTAETTQADQQ